MRVLIAGGGIGGLVAGLALKRIGLDPIVFESAPDIRPLGVGINLLPNADLKGGCTWGEVQGGAGPGRLRHRRPGWYDWGGSRGRAKPWGKKSGTRPARYSGIS